MAQVVNSLNLKLGSIVLSLGLVLLSASSSSNAFAQKENPIDSSDPDLCLKVLGQQARATSQKELDSIPTPPQCMPSENPNDDSSTGTATTSVESPNSLESASATIPGCGGRLFPKDMIPSLLAFRQQLGEGKIKWVCDSKGDMVVVSTPSIDIAVESLLKNLGETKYPIENFDFGFHSGYEFGIKAAQEGKPFVKGPISSSSQINPDFHRGYEEGYSQGFDAYIAIKRLGIVRPASTSPVIAYPWRYASRSVNGV